MPGLFDLYKLQAAAQRPQQSPLGGLLGAGPAPDIAAQFRAAGGNLLNTPIGPAYVAPQVNPSLGGLLGLGLEIAPGSGDALAIQDFNKANQVGDRTGATLAAASLIPGVGELAGAAKGLMGAKGALSMAGGLLGQTVFHGTPHDFDAFKLDKIGTGEGAQAYGHGLYFAENPEVAGAYVPAYQIDWPNTKTIPPHGRIAFDELAKHKGDVDKTVAALMERGPKAKEVAAWIAENRSNISFQPGGRLYTVDIPDSAIEKMLDWDKPLSEQPEAVRKAVQPWLDRWLKNANHESAAHRTLPDWVRGINDGSLTGEQLYRGIGGDKRASDALRAAGIPGIKYLDQGSRDAGNGTRNFVVFDDTLPKIVKKE